MTQGTTTSKTRTQVLVVGAGAVGLLAALRLTEQGIRVRVVDQHSEQRAHTFPVVLHPQSLRLLSDLGLSAALYWRGRPVTRLAVYTEHERRAVLDLPRAEGVAPGAMTLPQDTLRQALVTALSQRNVGVEWNTRLAALEQNDGSVSGHVIERDPLTASEGEGGAGVSPFEADFVIGADGYESSVREALRIELREHGPLHSFAFFDAPVRRAGTEAQLALGQDSSSSVYPLQDNVARFSFQLSQGLHSRPDHRSLVELIDARLPWFGEMPDACEWSGVAEFRHALASQFGRGRVWLAGEAAHLTGPLGVQSLNVGLDEANELALRMGDQLRHPLRDFFGADYEARRQGQWRELLGLEPRAALSGRSPDWARRYLPRLLACLPASGRDLDDLLDQLRLTLRSDGPPNDASPR